MNNFKKTLFFILFVYCKNLFASDLLEIRSGFNNNQYRLVLEFSGEINYKSEISNNNIEFYFFSQISKTNLIKLKDIPYLENLIFDNNLIKFEFDRGIKTEQLFNIKKK